MSLEMSAVEASSVRDGSVQVLQDHSDDEESSAVDSPASTAPSTTSSTKAPRPLSLRILEPPARTKSASLSSPTRAAQTPLHRQTASVSQIGIAPTPTVQQPSTPKSPNLLTALASQERRVLELKEELHKAEEELQRLKAQWESSEAAKRRIEGKKMHQMRPLNSASTKLPVKSSARSDDSDGSSAWMYQEMERRKALLGGARNSQRRVFSSSRHARTLSLLASEKQDSDKSDAESIPGKTEVAAQASAKDRGRANPLNRSSTVPDVINRIPEEQSEEHYFPRYFPKQRPASPTREDFLRQGKQMANDFKDGLRTLFEDLRQVTVGDEPRDAPKEASAKTDATSLFGGRRKQSPTRTKLERNPNSIPMFNDPSLVDVGASFWQDHGADDIRAPTLSKRHSIATMSNKTPKANQTPQKIPLHLREYDGETWETWDSPDPAKVSPAPSSSAASAAGQNSFGSPSTLESSPRTSISSDATPRAGANVVQKRESIPWPTLTKLSPGHLRRTASHLMEEWEKSLAPPEASRSSSVGNDDHDDASATVRAAPAGC